MSIGVVIVTFNRINKLKKALETFDLQTVLPDYVVVVNNASTDNTLNYLNEWENKKSTYSKYVITTKKNLGGSGGFYTGLKFAQNLKSKWIWVSDDDAFPKKNALEIAQKYLDEKKVSAVCGSVINNGRFDIVHRRNYFLRHNKVIPLPVPEEEYLKKEYFKIKCFSYVGTIINRDKLKLVGLPRKEYFIWFDDTEHSLRLSKVGTILCVPSIKVHHDVRTSTNVVSWKNYYGIRNTADMYRRHFSSRYYYRYCYANLFKSYINIAFNRKKKYNIMRKKAIFDAMHKKMGINDVYKPGWK